MKFIIIAILLFAVVSCGPKTIVDESSGKDRWQLEVVPSNKTLEIKWNKQNNELISGYNIYLSETTIVKKYPDKTLPDSIKPINTTPFPGDTDQDDNIEHYKAEKLENGKQYHVSVRVVYPDRSLSKPSNEVAIVCNPRGTIELSVRYSGEHDGYSFENDKYVGADASENDLYFFSKDGKDYLASPTRLDGFLKKSEFATLYKSFKLNYSHPAIWFDSISFNDRVEVKGGDWILLKSVDTSFTIISIKTLTGKNSDRKLLLDFYYRNSVIHVSSKEW